MSEIYSVNFLENFGLVFKAKKYDYFVTLNI